MHRWRLLAVVAGASLVFSACSSDDDDATPATSVATTTEDTAPLTQPASTAAEPTATRATAASAPTTLPSSATTSPATDPVPATTAAPTAAERLSRRLPSRRALGIPAEWLRRTLTSDLDDVPADEVDPFNGLMTCPGGPLVPSDAELWVEHRYTGTEPADDMISVRVVVIAENDAVAEARRSRLERCTAASPEMFVEQPDRGEQGGVTEVFASATASLPFPAAIAYATDHRDGYTVAVAVLGLNNGLGFAGRARQHLRSVLDSV